MMKIAMSVSSITHLLPSTMLLVAVRAAQDSSSDPGEPVSVTLDGKYVIKHIEAEEFHDYCIHKDLVNKKECLSPHAPEVLLGELQELDAGITEDTLVELQRQMYEAVHHEDHKCHQTRDKRFDGSNANVVIPVICKESSLAVGGEKFGGVPFLTQTKPECTEDFWLQLSHRDFPDFTIGLITAQRVTLQQTHGDVPAGTKIAHMVGIHKSSAYQVYELLRRYEILEKDVMPETTRKGFVSQSFVHYIRDEIAKDCKFLFVTPTNGFERTLQTHYGFENCAPGCEFTRDGRRWHTYEWTGSNHLIDTHRFGAVKENVEEQSYANIMKNLLRGERFADKSIKLSEVRGRLKKDVAVRAARANAVYEYFEHARKEDSRLNGGCFVLKLDPKDRKSKASRMKKDEVNL